MLKLLETIGTILSRGVGNVMLEINRLAEKLLLVMEKSYIETFVQQLSA